jgi:hypothetical protein
LKKRFLFVLPLLSFGVAACMQEKFNISYNGEGSYEDMVNSRLQCVEELTSDSSQVNVNVNSYAQSYPFSCGAFTMCMASKGYVEVPNGEGRLKVPEGMVVGCNMPPKKSLF